MSYAILMCTCYFCGRFFGCNPNKVPSTPDKDGVKQPVCKFCVARWNELRIEQGMSPHPPLAGAYGACDENELVY